MLNSIAGIPKERLQAYNAARLCGDKRSICHAPDYSMYFGRDGFVGACCYSRSNPLGKYPEQTIAQLWSGEKIEEMRGEMRRQILPRGCETCADQLVAGNYKGLLAAQFDPFARDPAEKPDRQYPSRMEFELSNKCNLECSMCTGFFSSSIRSNREQLPALPQVYDRRFVEQLKPFIPHLREAKFFGGEPFLIDLYYEIWELFIESNPSCRVAITTNGTVFTEKVRRVLENLNCQIIVSIDSLRKETYESIRGNAVFERVTGNLDTFMEINRRKRQPLGLAVCPMTTNWRELPEMVEYANRKGLGIFFNTVVFPRELSLKFLNPREQVKVVEFLRKALRFSDDAIEANNLRCLEDVCLQVEMWMKEKTADPEARIRLQCGLYLDRANSGKPGGRIETLLSLLAEENAGAGVAGEGDTSDGFREYMTAIWRVGEMLTADGILPGARYREADLQEYFRLCAQKIPETTLRKVYGLATRFPMEVLRTAGTHSPAEMIELAQVHVPA